MVYQQDDYYPFGMEINISVLSPKNEYLYNKKELQEETQEYDYGARFYDPVIARWTTMDPLAEKSRRWSPYNYVMGNPIRLIDPDGCDTAQRKAGIAEAQKWVAANDNGKGNTYEKGAKGKDGPGSNIDCSGLDSKAVRAGGEKDPNYGKANGVTNIDNNLPDVDPKDVVPGNLVTLNDDTHTGIVISVERDKKGNITNEKMIDSGGDPERNDGNGPSGPRVSNLITNGKANPAFTIGSYKKWDTKPDQTNSGNGNSGVTAAHQTNRGMNSDFNKYIVPIIQKIESWF